MAQQEGAMRHWAKYSNFMSRDWIGQIDIKCLLTWCIRAQYHFCDTTDQKKNTELESKHEET